MDALTVVLIIIVGVLIAASVALAAMYFRRFTDDERLAFIAACTTAVKTALAALADGKITAAEMVQIIKALVEVIAAISGKPAETVSAELGAANYLKSEPDAELKAEQIRIRN